MDELAADPFRDYFRMQITLLNVAQQNMINCHRDLIQPSPFVSQDVTLSLKVVETENKGFQGVNFHTEPINISPHISQTHCESALHVYCRDVASSLSDILNSNSELSSELSALHIKVQSSICSEMTRSYFNIESGVTICRLDQDSYSIYTTATQNQNDILINDKIVTKLSVYNALKDIEKSMLHNVRVLLLDIIGEEDCMQNWAYMSNEAAEFIVKELGIGIIVLNTASIDREADGGCVTNHKAVFERRNNLIVELAKLSHLQPGYGTVLLNITPHNTYADCGSCRIQFKPSDS